MRNDIPTFYLKLAVVFLLPNVSLYGFKADIPINLLYSIDVRLLSITPQVPCNVSRDLTADFSYMGLFDLDAAEYAIAAYLPVNHIVTCTVHYNY